MAFIDDLRSKTPQLRQAELALGLKVHVPDIGPLGRWGIPAKWRNRSVALREAQSMSYVAALPRHACCFDAILVDGRFRQACLLHALRLAHEHTLVMLHDYFRLTGSKPYQYTRNSKDQRASYNRTVNMWFEIVQRVDTAIVLRPKLDALAGAKATSDSWRQALASVVLDPA